MEAHPFSMSRRPDGTRLRLTIKAVGDFTRRIPGLKPGVRVLIDGPHGIFTARRSSSQKILMIAGGIGITPIRSLAKSWFLRDATSLCCMATVTLRPSRSAANWMIWPARRPAACA